MLASRYGTGQLTWFSVPFTLMQRVQRLLGTASGILFPRIARLSKSGDSAQVSETYRRAQKALIPVAIAMTVPLGAAAKPFLSAWISPEFADHAWQPMTVVAVAFAISGAGVGFVQTLLGLGQSRSVFYIEVSHVIINTSLLFPLTGMFGVTGAALSYLAGWLSLSVGQWVVSKHLGADASRGIGKLLAVTAVLTAPVAVAVHLAAAHLTPLGVLGPLSAAGLGTCTILGGLALSPWAFGQDATIAHELRGAPGRLLARLRRRG